MADNLLQVIVACDTTAVQEELKKANESLTSFQKVAEDVSKHFHGLRANIAVIGLAFQGLEKGFSWIKTGIAQFTAFGDQLDKMSIRTGIAAQSLSAMKFAAEQSGAGFEELCDAVKTFQEQLGAAKLGDAGAIGKLGAVGIRAEDMEGLSSQDQFMELAEHLSQITDRSEQTRAAIELFGDAGYKLLPMLRQGKDGMKAMMEEAERLGITMGQEDVASAAAMTDEINRLKSAISSIVRNAISVIVQPLTRGIEYVRIFSTGVASLIRKHETLLRGLLELGKFVIITKAAFLIGPQILSGWGLLDGAVRGTTFSMASARAAALALSTSLKGLMLSNPLGWGLAASGAVAFLASKITFTVERYQDMDKTIQDLDESSKAMNETIAKTGESLEAVNKEMEAVRDQVQTLAELADKEKLSNEEKRKTIDLVNQLNQTYPKLGLTIDETTGKVAFLTEKYIQMQREAAKSKLAAIAEERTGLTSRVEQASSQSEDLGQRLEDRYGRSVSGIGYKLTDSDRSWEERQKLADDSGYEDIRKDFAAYRKASQIAESGTDRLKDLDKQKKGVERTTRKNIEKYAQTRFEQAREKVGTDEEKASQDNLDEFGKREFLLNKEFKLRMQHLEAVRAEGEAMKKAGDYVIEYGEYYDTIPDKMEALQAEHQKEIEALKEEKRLKEQAIEDTLAKMEKEFSGIEDSEAQKGLETLREKNRLYLEQLKLKKGITDEDLKQAKAEADQREADYLQKSLAEGDASLETSPQEQAMNQAKMRYYETLGSGNATQEDIQKAKKNMDASVKEYQKYSAQKAWSEMTSSQGKADESRKKYEEAKKNGVQGNDLLTLQNQAIQDKKAAEEKTQAFQSLSDTAFQDRLHPMEKPESITHSSQGTFSAFGLDALTQSNIPKETLDWVKKAVEKLTNIDENSQPVFAN